MAHDNGKVTLVGDLRQIATQELVGRADLATLLAEHPHFYAIGMTEGLRGEVLVLDSIAYYGSFENLRYELQEIRAGRVAFLAHASVPLWRRVAVPLTVSTFKELESFIGEAGAGLSQPFPVRLSAKTNGLRWFVVAGEGNGLPNPRESFLRARFLGGLDGCEIDCFGIYSEHHKGIATSPNSCLHMHFKTSGPKSFVGHLDDDILLLPGASIDLPAS
jgi:hypothetical protein